jgi:hypothetical protein
MTQAMDGRLGRGRCRLLPAPLPADRHSEGGFVAILAPPSAETAATVNE